MVFVTIIFLPSAFAESTPEWVKNTAGWWSTGAISETEFINAMEFLINDKIIQVTSLPSIEKSENVPAWVKNTAGWWSTGAISETEFINAMEFLIQFGIINIKSSDNCEDDLQTISNNFKEIQNVCEEFNSKHITELIPYDVSHEYNKKGFVGKDFPEKKSNGEYRIFVLGGSVIQGAGNSSVETTIPYILQKMIDRNDENSTIDVINAAGSAGNSIYQTELILTTLTKYEPDLVIVLTGWNDLSADYPIKRIKAIWNEVCVNSKKNNFDVMIFLQPIAGFGNKNLTEQEKINSLTGQNYNEYQLIQQKSSYDYLARELNSLEQNCVFVDSRDMFDRMQGTVYWDQGHISESGNIIVAERFLEEIDKQEFKKINFKKEFTDIALKYNHPSISQFLFSELDIKINFSEISIKDENNIESEKGSYFKLKHKFGLDKIFVGKDLQGFDLDRIDFKGQDFTGANLSGHDLRNIDLDNTIIRGANLSFTNLEGVNLSGKDLRGIDFSNSNLKNVDFTDAIFSKPIQIAGDCEDKDPIINVIKNFRCVENVIVNESIRTNFTNADLSNAKFGTTENEIEQRIYFADFSNANLTMVNLLNVQFFGCNFSNSILDAISGKNLFFLKNDFSDVQMNDFEIYSSWFQSSSFKSGNMKNGIFENVTFIDIDLTNANLEKTEILGIFEFGENNYDCKNNFICQN